MRHRLQALTFILFVTLSVTCAFAQSAPSISALTPTGGPAGASVTITGSGFGATQGSSTVTFNGVAATPSGWSATSITLTGSLNTARMFQTMTVLDNGNVLIAGGVDGFGYNTITSAELYNPASATFALTGSLNNGRIFNTATLLNNGKVLIAGGTDSNWNNIATTELYDPVAGTFSFT